MGKRDDAAVIAAELARIWDQRIRYGYRSVHMVDTSAESVTLRAATPIGPGGTWLTATFKVALA